MALKDAGIHSAGDLATPLEGTVKAMYPLFAGFIYEAASDFNPGEFGTVEVPMAMFLIEHEKGLVLIDSGLNPGALEATDGEHGGYDACRPLAIFKATKENLVDAQLASLGISVSDLSTVIVSHHHLDHTGGLELLAEVPEVIIHAKEWDYVTSTPGNWPSALRPGDFATVDVPRLRTFTGDLDVFDDGSLVLKEFVGHSPGNVSALVRVGGQTIVLSLDTVHLRSAYEAEAAGFHDADPVAAVQSIQRLKQFVADENAELWVTHDPEDWRRYSTQDFS